MVELKGWRREVQLMINIAIGESRKLPNGYASCVYCGGIFSQSTMKTVLYRTWNGSDYSSLFCKRCRPEYDIVKVNSNGISTNFYKNEHVEVFPNVANN